MSLSLTSKARTKPSWLQKFQQCVWVSSDVLRIGRPSHHADKIDSSLPLVFILEKHAKFEIQVYSYEKITGSTMAKHAHILRNAAHDGIASPSATQRLTKRIG